jgi:hypothetical protein
MHKKIPEEIQISLKKIVDHFEKEDVAVRERQIRLYKRMEYYWAGIQNVYWDDGAHDWRVWNNDLGIGVTLDQAAYYDKPINVFRAYMESIIAALSAVVPGIKCIPDDADNPLDITTARGGDKIAELVKKHNDADLLWCKALFIYCTQGMVAAYNYSDTDKSYGEIEEDKTEDDSVEYDESVCPSCQMPVEGNPVAESLHLQDADEFAPDNEDILRNDLEAQGVLCENCQQLVNPEIVKKTQIITRIVGKTTKPKSRQKIDVNGGLFVRVPNWARCQADIPFLSYCYETHFTNVLKKYSHLREELGTEGIKKLTSEGSGYSQYERWGRLNTQYLGEYPLYTPTVRNWWLRPSAFEFESDDDIRKDLLKLFPDGCKVVFINDTFAEACNQSLDDCWTLTYNPLSEYLTFDPLGMLVASVQDITNDLVSLTLQTIEHGIPQTFADPGVLNFKQYSETEATPGAIYPAKPKAGQDIAKGFHTIQTASLGREVEPFSERIQNLGQFVSGAQPSLFGGALPSSARTASQYNMSKNQAMQRLQTPWKMINFWWKNLFGKVIPAYMKTMLDDEKIVRKNNNSFVNDMVRLSEVQGKIGEIELESTEEIPQSWSQIRDVLMNLIETQNEGILSALFAPENLEILRQSIGLTQFKIPGQDSRQKQYREIQALLQSGPIEMEGQSMPSIEPEIDVDEHAIEIEICQGWLRSDEGQLTKAENKPGYDNVVAHMKVHQFMMSQIQMMQMGPAPSGQNPNGAPVEEPVNG